MEERLSRWFRDRGLIVDQVPNVIGHIDIEPDVRLFGVQSLMRCTIGAYTYLAPTVNANSAIIGRYCSIGDRVTISPSQHPVTWLSTSPFPYKDIFDTSRPQHAQFAGEVVSSTVGNDVWIGANSAIMGGVSIGDGAIIAYGSVVTKDVPAYAIVGGAPARIIRMRFPSNVIASLQDLSWWNYDLVKGNNLTVSWNEPLVAVATLRTLIADGDIVPISAKRNRFIRSGPAQFSCKALT